jgi:hypothetical protein
MRAVAVVNSPLQVICAWEWEGFLVEERKVSVPRVELVIVSSSDSGQQTRLTATRLGMPYRVVDASGGMLAARRLWRSAAREMDALEEEDIVAIGDPAYDLFRHVAASTRTQNLWVLDDGVATWRYLDAVVRGERRPMEPRRSWRSFAKNAIVRQARPRRGACEADWFSIFAPFQPRHPRIHVNALRRLKAFARAKTPRPSVVFLGSPVIEAGILTKADYISVCREATSSLRRTVPGAPLIYLRHRRERYREEIGAMFDQVEDSGGPVELEWLDAPAVPTHVAGVFSTGLLTLAFSMGSAVRVTVFWPTGSCSVGRRRGNIRRLRQLFEAAESRGFLTVSPVGCGSDTSWDDREAR